MRPLENVHFKMTGFYRLAIHMIFSLLRYRILSRESQVFGFFFEMSIYLKLEMTLTYSSYFTSSYQGRGGKLSEKNRYWHRLLIATK